MNLRSLRDRLTQAGKGSPRPLTVPEEIDVRGMRPLSRTRCTKLRRNEQQLSLANYFEQQENLDAARSMRPGWPTRADERVEPKAVGRRRMLEAQ